MFAFGHLELPVRFDKELVLETKTVVSGIDAPPVYRIGPLVRIAVPEYRHQRRVALKLEANDFPGTLFSRLQLGQIFQYFGTATRCKIVFQRRHRTWTSSEVSLE